MEVNLYEERIRRMVEWINGGKAPPLKVILFTTFYCNLNCLACGVSEARKRGDHDYSQELSPEVWEDMVADLASFGILDWDFTGGGEPMSNERRIIKVISKIKEITPHSNVELTSNSTWFTHENIEALIATGLDKVQFSVDGWNAETHNFLRQTPNTHEKATAAIKRFSQRKRELGVDKPQLYINTVLSAKNFDRFREFVEWDREVGVNAHMITPMRVTSDTRGKIERGGLRLTDEQRKQVYTNYEEVRPIAESYGINLDLLLIKGQEDLLEDEDVAHYTTDDIKPCEENPYLGSHCFEPWYSFCLDPYGSAGSCVTAAGFGQEDFNLTKRSMEEIWYSGYFAEIRRQILDREPLSVCSHCTIGDARVKFREEVLEYMRKVESGEQEPFRAPAPPRSVDATKGADRREPEDGEHRDG